MTDEFDNDDFNFLDNYAATESDREKIAEAELELESSPNYIDAQWTRLESYWNSVFHFNVVGNYELKSIFFHTLLGSVLPTKCKKEGRIISPRVHVFIIQRSGTGKSVSMKLLANVMRLVAGKERIDFVASSTTEAGLIGSIDVNQKSGVVIPRYGALFEQVAIFFDEGNGLFSKNNPNSRSVLEALQIATDEPGMIAKRMRNGKIEYETHTTIVAGSYPTVEISETILHQGFFQRVYLHYNTISDEEIDTLQRDRIGLQNIPNFERETALIHFVQLVKEVVEKASKEIEIHPASYEKFFTEWNEYTKNFRRSYTSDAAQSVLESFISRIEEMIVKIALIHAVCSRHSKILYNDFVWAKKYGERQIHNVMRLLDKVEIKSDSYEKRRENIILQIVRDHPGIIQNDIIKMLNSRRKLGRWDFGIRKTLAKLDELVEMKHLGIKHFDARSKTYYVIDEDFST